MDKINFLAKDDFPASSDTLDMMQNMMFLISKLSLLGGDNYILEGCVLGENNIVSTGTVVINGEILPFQGGLLADKIKIETTKKTLEAFDELYPEAYIYKKAIFDENGDYDWSSFKLIPGTLEINRKIENLTLEEPGIVKMWSGDLSRIPNDYLLCDGRSLSKEEYPDLFENIGYMHGIEGVDNFRIPNLQGRFTVGYDHSNNDYKAIGNSGGADKVTLKESEMPNHRHKYTDDTNAQGRFPDIEVGFPQTHGGINNTDSSGSSRGSGTVYYTSTEGGVDGKALAHENRPPYFVLAYVIKVR